MKEEWSEYYLSMVEQLKSLDNKEKVNVYLQTFVWSDFYNHVDVMETGKIKLTCDPFERPRYYTPKGILREFNKCIKENVWIDQLFETYQDRLNGDKVDYVEEEICL